ncbi:hypothetical protein ACLI1A_12110 [Flavobacterium sp. RHBU_3]|uniref:hypothetical protein n=1 Tax=Flavobacterium sp. RHBU_3 TaxID=3391184 RepID=UPI0039853BB3
MKNQFYLVLFLIFVSITGYAQNNNGYNYTNGLILNDSIHDVYKALYIKRQKCESCAISDEALKEYKQSINYSLYSKEIDVLAGMDKWAAANLSKTNFKTLEEANKVYADMLLLNVKCIRDNGPFYDLQRKILFSEGGEDMWKQVLTEIAQENPELFLDPMSKFKF